MPVFGHLAKQLSGSKCQPYILTFREIAGWWFETFFLFHPLAGPHLKQNRLQGREGQSFDYSTDSKIKDGRSEEQTFLKPKRFEGQIILIQEVAFSSADLVDFLLRLLNIFDMSPC